LTSVNDRLDEESAANNDESLFSFKYTESGGLSNKYLLVSYDSATKEIKVSTDMTGSNLAQKTLADSDEEILRECFEGDKFFGFNADYPAEKETEKDDSSILSFTLIVTKGSKVHTVIWTNKSTEVPDELTQIKTKIKEMVSNKKMI
jgi:hypothetical protein